MRVVGVDRLKRAVHSKYTMKVHTQTVENPSPISISPASRTCKVKNLLQGFVVEEEVKRPPTRPQGCRERKPIETSILPSCLCLLTVHLQHRDQHHPMRERTYRCHTAQLLLYRPEEPTTPRRKMVVMHTSAEGDSCDCPQQPRPR